MDDDQGHSFLISDDEYAQELDDDLGDNLASIFGDEYAQGLDDDLGDNIASILDDEYAQELDDDLGDNLGDNLASIFGDEYAQELDDDLGDNLDSIFGDEFAQGLDDDLGDNLDSIFGDEYAQGLDDDVGDNIASILDDEYAQELDDDQGHIVSIFDDEYVQKLDGDQGPIVFTSDDEYAQELQLQEALMASVTPQNTTIKSSLLSSSLPSSSKAVEVSLDCKKIKFTNEEAGESSQIICEICAETKESEQMFGNKICDLHNMDDDQGHGVLISDDNYAQELGDDQGHIVSIFDDEYAQKLDDDQGPTVFASDDEYAQELQLQEALMASVTPQNTTIKSSLLLSLPSSSKAVAVSLDCKKIKFTNEEEAGESSQIICEICAETKESEQMFWNKICDHSFCSDCVIRQVATKLQENITVVACLGLDCKGVLELDVCRPMLPKVLVDRWDEALCEALFLAAPKFYCPFKDCSAMLLVDNKGEDIRESECPFCHRLFCAKCNAPWHPGVDCDVFQNLNKDERGREDLLVRELANEKKWSRCPKCKFYVEKIDGCLHITCRCKFEFCYACGEQWTTTHGGCQ